MFLLAMEIKLYGSNEHFVFIAHMNITAIKKVWRELHKEGRKLDIVFDSFDFFLELV